MSFFCVMKSAMSACPIACADGTSCACCGALQCEVQLRGQRITRGVAIKAFEKRIVLRTFEHSCIDQRSARRRASEVLPTPIGPSIAR
jgi:hypothetical protein